MYHYPSNTPVIVRQGAHKGFLITIVVLLSILIVLAVFGDLYLIAVLQGIGDILQRM